MKEYLCLIVLAIIPFFIKGAYVSYKYKALGLWLLPLNQIVCVFGMVFISGVIGLCHLAGFSLAMGIFLVPNPSVYC